MNLYNINKAYDMQNRIEYKNGRIIVEYDKKYETQNEMYTKMTLYFMEHIRLNLSEFMDVSPDASLDGFIMNTALVMAEAVIYIGKDYD